MNKEYIETFNTCITMIETIDLYIRDISEENIEDYMDFFPFIDEDDIMLYKDIDKNLILSYTRGIFLKKQPKFKNKKDLFYRVIVSYILALKIISDCSIYKPYSFILEMLREFDDLGKISKSLESNENDEYIIKNLIKIEWDIVIKCNFFINNDIGIDKYNDDKVKI